MIKLSAYIPSNKYKLFAYMAAVYLTYKGGVACVVAGGMSVADGVRFSTSTTFAASGLLRTYLLLVKLRHSIIRINNVYSYLNTISCCLFAAVLTT